MKKTAYILGVAGLIIFAATLLFPGFHIAGSSLLIGYGTIFNEIIVLPFIAFYVLKSGTAHKMVDFLVVLSIFLLIGGLFFKLQHWPGSFIIAASGFVLFCLSTILFANYSLRKTLK